MKTQIIALESHDDLISVRDRMSWAKVPRILLVWPKYEKVTLRAVDLKVLQRHARSLGAVLGLVTRRADVRRDAEALGIAVFESAGAAQRNPWPGRPASRWRGGRTPRRDLRALREQVRVREADWRSLPAARVGFFGLGALAVLTVAALFVPRATVTLLPESQTQSVIIPVTAGPSVQTVLITGSVPARQVSVVVTGTQTMTITSQAPIPESKARGVARFNNLTQSELYIPAGTVVYAPGVRPVRFVTLNEAYLPAGLNQFVEAPIEAVEPGAAGNLGADVIQAVEGPLGLSAAVTNPDPMSGGTNKTATAPLESDRVRARNLLLASLQTRAIEQMRAALAEGDLTLLNTVNLAQVLEEEYDPPPGQPGTLLTLTMRAEFAAQYLSAADLAQLAEASLNAALPPGFGAKAGSLTFKLSSEPATDEQGAAHFDLKVERLLLRQIEPLQVIMLIRGRSPQLARASLAENLPLAGPPEIKQVPSWWPWLPLLPFRISVLTQ